MIFLRNMDEISDAFKLEEYFPALKVATHAADFGAIQASLEALKSSDELPLPY